MTKKAKEILKKTYRSTEEELENRSVLQNEETRNRFTQRGGIADN